MVRTARQDGHHSGFFYTITVDYPYVVQMTAKQDPLRLTAAVILGIITGSILFFVVALVIGAFNDMMHMNISVTTNVAENILSLLILVVLIIVCVAGFWWKVETTPPTEPEPEMEPVPEQED
jgi:hypothetical protein